MRVCMEPGCPTLTDATRCEAHRKARRRKQDARRPSAAARGYDERWRRTRRSFLRAHPVCQHEAGCIQPATDVHHLDGLGPRGPRGHDRENLVSLCHAHHSAITAKMQPGGWR